MEKKHRDNTPQEISDAAKVLADPKSSAEAKRLAAGILGASPETPPKKGFFLKTPRPKQAPLYRGRKKSP